MRKLTAIAFAIALSGAALPLPRGHAAAVELHVLTAGAVQEGEKKLADEYRHMTGNRVKFVAGTVGQIQERLKNREATDVIVVSKTAMEQLEKAGEPVIPENLLAGEELHTPGAVLYVGEGPAADWPHDHDPARERHRLRAAFARGKESLRIDARVCRLEHSRKGN